MHPSLLTPAKIENYLAKGMWSRETMVDRYRQFARTVPDRLACRDERDCYSWTELDKATDRVAANLIELGLERDSTALVQTASSCLEVLIRIAFKKAGIIGAFTPLQWRRKELDYVVERIAPSLIITDGAAVKTSAEVSCRVDIANGNRDGWIDWDNLLNVTDTKIPDDRPFAFDEVSLITVSSGTSGIAKLCEWPEAAQVCMGRTIGERMGFRDDDTVGIFAPMSGAAGLLVWLVSATTPCTYAFPATYQPDSLLDLAEKWQVTICTTVPVILARLAQEEMGSRNLRLLRMLRVGTAATDIDAARGFERRTGCKVITASGAMECPGFGHAGPNEPIDIRLDGSVGLPLKGCQLRIDDERGAPLPWGEIGQLKVLAPFASSGYWNDPQGSAAVWRDDWYATGDMGRLDDKGRLTLLGRIKETINRSGHKILPIEIETEIAKHPDVFACAVAGAPDREYGSVPWAFVQLRTGRTFEEASLTASLRDSGMASYKIPVRFVEVAELPRINGNKVDKQALLTMATLQ